MSELTKISLTTNVESGMVVTDLGHKIDKLTFAPEQAMEFAKILWVSAYEAKVQMTKPKG